MGGAADTDRLSQVRKERTPYSRSRGNTGEGIPHARVPRTEDMCIIKGARIQAQDGGGPSWVHPEVKTLPIGGDGCKNGQNSELLKRNPPPVCGGSAPLEKYCV